MTSLRDEARRLTNEVVLELGDSAYTSAAIVESALLAFAKLVLEQKPEERENMMDAGIIAYTRGHDVSDHVIHVYRAMTAELLRELTEDRSTIGSHQPKEQP